MRNIISSLTLAAFVTFASSETLQGRVISVADGDTITVLDASHEGHKIRLAGIDAPEKKQPFGYRSTASLAAMTFGRQVTVETDKNDRYGRAVGKVLIDGRDVNLMQIERGMAWFYRAYQKEQSPNDRLLYESAERAAQTDRKGLWADVAPVPPWEYRKQGRSH